MPLRHAGFTVMPSFSISKNCLMMKNTPSPLLRMRCQLPVCGLRMSPPIHSVPLRPASQKNPDGAMPFGKQPVEIAEDIFARLRVAGKQQRIGGDHPARPADLPVLQKILARPDGVIAVFRDKIVAVEFFLLQRRSRRNNGSAGFGAAGGKNSFRTAANLSNKVLQLRRGEIVNAKRESSPRRPP